MKNGSLNLNSPGSQFWVGIESWQGSGLDNGKRFFLGNRSGENEGKGFGFGTDLPPFFSALAETVFRFNPDP